MAKWAVAKQKRARTHTLPMGNKCGDGLVGFRWRTFWNYLGYFSMLFTCLRGSVIMRANWIRKDGKMILCVILISCLWSWFYVVLYISSRSIAHSFVPPYQTWKSLEALLDYLKPLTSFYLSISFLSSSHVYLTFWWITHICMELALSPLLPFCSIESINISRQHQLIHINYYTFSIDGFNELPWYTCSACVCIPLCETFYPTIYVLCIVLCLYIRCALINRSQLPCKYLLSQNYVLGFCEM